MSDGFIIRQAMKSKEISILDIQNELGISNGDMYKILKSEIVRDKRLPYICDMLGLSIKQFKGFGKVYKAHDMKLEIQELKATIRECENIINSLTCQLNWYAKELGAWVMRSNN